MRLTAAPASAEDWSTAGPPDRTAVQIRPVRRLTAALWAATLLAALAVLALTLIIWGDLKLSDGISSLYIPVASTKHRPKGGSAKSRDSNTASKPQRPNSRAPTEPPAPRKRPQPTSACQQSPLTTGSETAESQTPTSANRTERPKL